MLKEYPFIMRYGVCVLKEAPILDTTEEALEMSILKWKTILAMHRKGIDVEKGWPSESCALCRKFLEKGCEGCAVYEKTGRTFCMGTPFEMWSHVRYMDDNLQYAEEELKFLESLRISWAEKVLEEMKAVILSKAVIYEVKGDYAIVYASFWYDHEIKALLEVAEKVKGELCCCRHSSAHTEFFIRPRT